jgi:hypothetical protein
MTYNLEYVEHYIDFSCILLGIKMCERLMISGGGRGVEGALAPPTFVHSLQYVSLISYIVLFPY